MNNVIFFPAFITRDGGHWHHGERFTTLKAMVRSLAPKDYDRLIAWDRRRRWGAGQAQGRNSGGT